MSSSVADYCNQGNEEYVSENYKKAVELYTEALRLDDTRDDVYCHRAQALTQLGNLSDAAADCDRAIQLNNNNRKAYLKKGTILFEMNEVEKALEVFTEGDKKFASDEVFSDWVTKCKGRLPSTKPSGDGQSAPKDSQPSIVAPATPAPSKIKYDWYQTHTHVVVTVLMKNIKKENLSVNVEPRSLKVTITSPDKDPLILDISLAHQVDSEQTTTKVLTTKVEIKLKKGEGIQWSKLEGDPDAKETVYHMSAVPVPEDAPRYPSSSLHPRDWDKLASEITEEEKNEKLEGDAGLNQFFQKIYADASDDTKKAMMKSFTESGGTVLSTNWGEVGSKKVDVKPPDGMEYKKWEN